MKRLPFALLALLGACTTEEPMDPEDEPSVEERALTKEPAEGFRWDDSLGQIEIPGSVNSSTVSQSSSGDWESRSVGGGGYDDVGGISVLEGGGDYAMAPEADAPPPPPPPPGGPGGLAMRGEGMGGGGSATGLGGIGSTGARGYGGGGGKTESGRLGRKGSSGPSGGEEMEYAKRLGDTAPVSTPLRAGATDDNSKFDAYLQFIADWNKKPDVAGQTDMLDVTGRRFLRVVGPDGSPVPGARLSLVDTGKDRVAWSGRSFGDGRVPFYPNLVVPHAGIPAAGSAPEGGWLVQAEKDGVMTSTHWDGLGTEIELVLDMKKQSGPVPLDVCFIIDTTGSMGDEIERIKQTLLAVTEKLRQEQEVDLRYGAVLYRDVGDEYLTMKHPFTADLQGFDEAIQGISAGGGGDGPESLNQGVAVAVGGMKWRPDAARVAFLVADAPPHMDYQETVTYGRGAAAALHGGIRVHTVAASGLDDRGSVAFRQLSQLTRGEFIFIEYGSTAASAADHGVTGHVASNNLDSILYERIRREIRGWGREEQQLTTTR